MTRPLHVRAGQCRCGKEPRRPGRVLGVACARAEAAYGQKRNRERRAAGLCVTCALPVDRDGVRCAACHEKYQPRGAVNVTRARRAREGLCRDCGAPLVGMISDRCADCLVVGRQVSKARRAALLEQGICVDCRRRPPAKSKTRCGWCLMSRRAAAKDGPREEARREAA